MDEVKKKYLVKLPHISDLLKVILWPFNELIQGFLFNDNAVLLVDRLGTDFCFDNPRFDFFELTLSDYVIRDDLSEPDEKIL